MTKAADLANLIGNINAGGGGSANRNLIINGAMNVAQRATSATGLGGSGAYDGFNTCDRWGTYFNTSGALTMSQDSSAPDGFGKSLKFACTTADTSIASNEYIFLTQRIEGQNLQGFAKGTSDAKPFAVSFYVKGNASATYVCELWDNDNSRQISKTFTVGTDWSRVELSFPADTTGAFDNDNARSFDFRIWLHAGSQYTSGTISSDAWISNSNNRVGSGTTSFLDSTSRTFFLTGVQVEVGQNPTEFEHEPVERTLLKCQRYYVKYSSGTLYARLGIATNLSTVAAEVYNYLPVAMRDDPSLETTGTLSNYCLYDSDDVITITSMVIEGGSHDNNQLVIIDCSCSGGGLTDGGASQLMGNNNTSAFIAFSSEV